MPKLPTNQQYLERLKELAASRKSMVLATAEQMPGDTIIPSSLPTDLKDWLGQLALLYGVPFDNFVANESLLPKESVRFFFLDENWINSLLDGALSIGTQSSKNTELLSMVSPAIKMESKWYRRQIRPRILRMAAPQTTEVGQTVSGLLLRSEVVSGWPGLEIMGYTGTVGENEIKKLRMERLSPDIMLVLFDGVPQKVIIAEPKEGLRFGVADSGTAGIYWIQPRYLGSNANQPTGKPASQSNDKYAVAKFRGTTGTSSRVLDVLKTINSNDKGILAQLNALQVGLPSTGFHAAAFGVEMIYTSEEATFSYDESKMPPASIGCPLVATP